MDAFKDGLIAFLFWLMIGSGALVVGIAAKETIQAIRNPQYHFPKFDPAPESEKNKSRRTPVAK